MAAFALTVVFLVVLTIAYGSDLEYRFEIAVISITWITLLIASVLLGIFFRRSTYA